MTVYDVYFKASTPKLMRSGLTEQQVDEFWNSIKWWERQTIEIRSREITVEKEQEER